MRIEEAVYGRLAADAAVLALCGGRVYPGQAPQGSALPVVVYGQADQVRLQTLAGVVNLNRYSMRLDVWAEDYAGAKALYHAVRDSLVGFSGTLGSVDVRGVFEESGDDDSEAPVHAEETGLYRAGLGLAIHYNG
jgi:hypothetical protein